MTLRGNPAVLVPRDATRETQDVIKNIARRLAAIEAAVNLLPTPAQHSAGGLTAVDLAYQEFVDRGIVRNSAGDNAVIPVFTATSAGLVPAPLTEQLDRFLRDDGTWVEVGAGSFNPDDEVYADIIRFSLVGGQGTTHQGAGGLALTGWTLNNPQGNTGPMLISGDPIVGRRLYTSYGTGASWGARTTSTVVPMKIGANGVGDFLIVLDFSRQINQAWDGQFFVGASSGTLSNPIETHAADFVGFMRPSTLGNYHTAVRAASGSTSLVDTGIGLGANDGSVSYRFVVAATGVSVLFRIYQFNGSTNRYDILLYESTITSGLPITAPSPGSLALSPVFGGPSAQNVNVSVRRFSGWARM